MRKQTTFFFYLLSIYVLLQFAWWGYHLIELTMAVDANPNLVEKRVLMVIGEGTVFILLLLLGLWKIRSSVRKEFEVSRNQNNFLLSVTHELKTPIAANKLYLQTIQKRNLPEEQKEDLINKALKENERLENLISNILNAAQVESQSLQPIKEKIDLSIFIPSILNQIQKRYPQAEFNLAEIPSLFVEIDPFMIETVISNLIDNAVKYSSEKANISISINLLTKFVQISVMDQGIGINEKEHKNIFLKFYRVGNEEIRIQKGSGLGLFIASEFLKLHDGNISYLPNKPTGSIFQINLPL